MKQLEVLGIYKTPKHPSDFLQHISKIGNIKIEKGQNYIDFFNILKSKYTDKEHLCAVNEFIEFNMSEVGEDTLKNTIIDEEEDVYIVLNFINTNR